MSTIYDQSGARPASWYRSPVTGRPNGRAPLAIDDEMRAAFLREPGVWLDPETGLTPAGRTLDEAIESEYWDWVAHDDAS